jgi:adenylate cyclase
VGGFLYFTKLETTKPPAIAAAVPSPTPTMAATAPAPEPAQSTMATAGPVPMPSPSTATGGKFPADMVPFINERVRTYLSNEYAAAGDYKAFALNIGGFTGSALNQPNEEVARNMALEQCQRHADAAQSPRRCELYAVGNNVVYTHGKPPMPPQPWIRHDAMTERAFASKDFPILRDPAKVRLESLFVPAAKSRTVALGPGGQYYMVFGAPSVDDSARRSLESCGAIAGVACMIVAVDDSFVVPIPSLLKVTGFFHAASNASIVADARDEVVRKLADGTGWNAVAAGTAGRPGLGLKAADEQTAVNSALADCARHDSECHIIAIGPFTVGPTN